MAIDRVVYTADQTLAEFAMWHYGVATGIAEAIDYGVQRTLLDSGYHPRYEDITKNGLAIVLAEDHKDGRYNPFNDEVGAFDQLAFVYSNEGTMRKDKQWIWKTTDIDVLSAGTEIPESIKRRGRFVVMATAKVAHLEANPDILSSHSADGPKTGVRGEVAYAGGKRSGEKDNSEGAGSGAWHLQDLIFYSEFSYLLSLARDHNITELTDGDIRTLKEIATTNLIEQFNALDLILLEMGKEPTELTGEEEAQIIGLIEHSYLENLAA